MPLVKYIGNSTPHDLTGAIRLKDDEDGTPRELVLGGPAVDVDGEEIQSIAANGYQVEFIEPGSDEDDSQESSADPAVQVTSAADVVPPAGTGASSGAQAVSSGDGAAVVNPASTSPTTSTPAQPGS